jgi:hypothetical protein
VAGFQGAVGKTQLLLCSYPMTLTTSGWQRIPTPRC